MWGSPVFKNIFSSNTYLTIDIGTASLKMAVIKKDDKSKPQFLNYGYLESFEYLERSNAAFQTSTLRLGEQDIAGYIKALMKESNLEKHPVIASLPSFSTFTTLLEVPTISDSEIAQSIALQARQYIPIPIEDAILDWIKVGERTEEDGTRKTQLFLISVPKEVVAKYQRIFKLADLELKYLEVEGLSLARALTSASTPPTLIIDIGSRSSVIIVAENGFPKFINQTDFAGGSLTAAVATGLGLASRRAEEIKRRRGLTSSGGEYELFTVLQPLLDVIINESVRVKKNYENTYRATIKKVVLSGGGANLPGILRYFTKEIGLPAYKANPFDLVAYPEAMQSFVEELGPFFHIVIGLGLRK